MRIVKRVSRCRLSTGDLLRAAAVMATSELESRAKGSRGTFQ